MHKVCIDKIEDLNLMADGMLEKSEAILIEAHLSECSACNSYFNDIKAMKSVMSSMHLEAPSGLNERISKAVRNTTVKPGYMRHIYRYATVAAACLALAVVFFASGTFKGLMKSDKYMETSEVQERGENLEDQSAIDNAEGENVFGSKEDAAVPDAVSAPELSEPADDESEVLNSISEELADYRFSTSAIENPETIMVNPEGMPLDSGYGGMQDVFYASGIFTLDEISDIITKEFNISDIRIESDNIFFYINTSMLPELESRLGLVSAGKLKGKMDEAGVRIISLMQTKE